jgi:formate/nitrite transporter
MNFFTPSETLNNYVAGAPLKAVRGVGKTLLLAIAAGMFIAFGAAAANTVSFAWENVSLARLLSGLVFPFGLAMVMLCGAELFTGNCMLVICAAEKIITPARLFRNWALVYLGNFIGAMMLAGGCVILGQFNYGEGALAVYTIKIAAGKSALNFLPALISGFFCNVLVCAGVLCSLSAKDIGGKIMGAYIPVAFFVICGFEHSIANMYYLGAGLLSEYMPLYAQKALEAGINTAALNWGNILFRNLLPVTAGNILGGAALAFALRRGSDAGEKRP